MWRGTDTYWTLVEHGKVLHRSGIFGRLISFTAKEETTDAEIYFREPEEKQLVWTQNPWKWRESNA